jgi:VWFA-related protein
MSHLVALLIVLTLVIPATSQSPSNQQTPPSNSAPITTLRTGTKLVVVDVIVTDKKQQPVHDLKAPDFTLLENNSPQTFRAFEEHTESTDSAAVRPAALRPPPPGIFTNYTPFATSGPLNILLIDRLNTELTDQMNLTKQVNLYLKNMKPGTRLAIFGLNTKLIFLQGFTDNPEILQASITKEGKFKSSPLLNDPVGGNGVQERTSDVMADSTQAGSAEQAALSAVAVANMEQFQRDNDSVQSQLRAKYTLDAMNALSRYLIGFHGRKNLVWFSGSFPINILPYQYDDKSLTPVGADFHAVASSEKEFRETTALLSRAQVAVYPIDAHGLANAPMYDASTGDPTGKAVHFGAAALVSDKRAFDQATFDAHATMYQMAIDTGGHAYVNTNDLATALESALSNGANYYTIAYTPTDPNWNGNFRTIQVKLAQQGYTLAYRRGYFADDPDAMPKNEVAPGSTAPAASDAMRLALLRGGPAASQIVFQARVLPVSNTTEDAVAPNNNPSKTLQGPYRRYAIHISADPRAMAFVDTPEGTHHDNVEFVSFLYDS